MDEKFLVKVKPHNELRMLGISINCLAKAYRRNTPVNKAETTPATKKIKIHFTANIKTRVSFVIETLSKQNACFYNFERPYLRHHQRTRAVASLKVHAI